MIITAASTSVGLSFAPNDLKTARASGLGLYIEQRNVTWVDAHKKDRRTREKRQGAGRHRQERDRQRDKERGQET